MNRSNSIKPSNNSSIVALCKQAVGKLVVARHKIICKTICLLQLIRRLMKQLSPMKLARWLSQNKKVPCSQIDFLPQIDRSETCKVRLISVGNLKNKLITILRHRINFYSNGVQNPTARLKTPSNCILRKD